jgi:hypothetical protein
MIGLKKLLVFIIASEYLHFVTSFASWMENDYCDRKIREGEIIMNEQATQSDYMIVKVHRDGKEIRSNETYELNEVLQVSLAKSDGDFIFEVSNAVFIDGGCDGRRIHGNDVSLQMPSTEKVVSIRVGWASGHIAVLVSKDFFLLPHSSTPKSEEKEEPKNIVIIRKKTDEATSEVEKEEENESEPIDEPDVIEEKNGNIRVASSSAADKNIGDKEDGLHTLIFTAMSSKEFDEYFRIFFVITLVGSILIYLIVRKCQLQGNKKE